MDILARAQHELQLSIPLLPTYLHLLVSALFPIYTASHASLTRPSSAAPSKKSGDDTDEDDELSPAVETLKPSDAILFPLLAGATLTGLYFILKAIKDPAWFNYYLGLYFAFIGMFFAIRFFKDGLVLLRSVVFPLQYSRNGLLWQASAHDVKFTTKNTSTPVIDDSPFPGILSKIPLPKSATQALWRLRRQLYTKARLEFSLRNAFHVKMNVDILDIVSLVLSGAVIGYHTFIGKPWFLTNLLGFSFCYGSLQFMTPGTSWTGTLLLSALFFYDIYFVFYTPMMVTVATKLDVPIKLLFPRPSGCVLPLGAAEDSVEMKKYIECLAKKRAMAMLGLGDIVIPGMMLAFALRFDLYLYYSKMMATKSSNSDKDGSLSKPQYKSATGSWGERLWTRKNHLTQELLVKQFPRPYFYTTVVGYLAGMIATVLVMQVYQHAQPALLYLVPGVLISFWGTAVVRGELKMLWNFSEVPEDDASPKKKDADSSPSEKKSDNNADGQLQKQEKTPGTQKTSDSAVSIQSGSNSTALSKNTHVPANALVYFAITTIEPKTDAQPAPSSKEVTNEIAAGKEVAD